MPDQSQGHVIANRYEVRRNLGSGAYGQVLEVFDHHLGQVSALKLFNPTTTNTWAEAQVLTHLDGEFILPVRNADIAQGVPYVVTALATHGTVGSKIIPEVGVPTARAVRWTRQACQGLARIHDHKLLHRDIKPDNLFLTGELDALVGDLGLAQLHDQNGCAEVAGTPVTAAPEVAAVAALPQDQWDRFRPYTVLSDIYSLGASLFWMLAGQPPFRTSGGDVGSLLAQIAAGPPPDVWDHAPHIPLGLRDIVNKAIAHKPEDRHQSPAQLDAALGGRALPSRVWTRQVPHDGHVQCFTGTKKDTCLEVCAVPVGTRTQVEIQVRYPSGRRFGQPWTKTPLAQLPRALRTVFRHCA